jgi:hypothetical protein
MSENKQVITDKIMEQVLEIRDEGRFNMFEVTNIRNESLIKGFDELYDFLGEHRKEYCNFILTGER